MIRLGILIALTSLFALPSDAGTAIAGSDQVDLVAPAGVEIASYRNAGYELERRAGRIRIRVDMRPLGSESAFRLPALEPGTSLDEVEGLARALAAGSRNHYVAVSRILSWVSTEVAYRLDREASQVPPQVLERRTAYCTGYARLSVALLEAIGITAREVAGIVLQEGPTGEAQFHRWVEVYYPGVGWAFSDPARSHHYVPATYLRLASSRVRKDASRIPTKLLLDQLDELVVVDIYPYGAPRIVGRRNSHTQRASVLRITTEENLDLTAELEGAGQRQLLELPGGQGTFLGLDPGIYRLKLSGQGYPGLQGRIRVAAGERRWLQLPASNHRLSSATHEGTP